MATGGCAYPPWMGVGCHGWKHLDGTAITIEEFRANLTRCKATIEMHTGQSPDTVAFTWGHFNQRMLDEMASLEMRHAFSCIHGAISYPLRQSKAIERIDIRPELMIEDFEAIVRGDWDYLGMLQYTRHLLRNRHVR